MTRSFSSRLAMTIAHAGGLGHLRLSGTMASMIAVIYAAFIHIYLPPSLFNLILWGHALIAFNLGLWALGKKSLRAKDDPSAVVIDEIAGQWLCLAILVSIGYDFSWSLALGTLVLFRFFDIVKPWPVNSVEKLPAPAIAVMADDLVAALYAAAVWTGWSIWAPFY